MPSLIHRGRIAWLLLTTVPVLLAVLAASSRRAPSSGSHSAAYQSAERKIDSIEQHGRTPLPQPVTTTLTADETNAYLTEGGVALPAGVESIRFASVPAVVTATGRVDFDKLTAGRRSGNPLLLLFSGVHDVVIEAQAAGARGVGSVRVGSVSMDGVKVPRAALQLLVDHYLKPKYGPNIGLDSTFRLPARIDTAVVGNNQVTLTQR